VESYPYSVYWKASDILTSLAAFLFSSHQKREWDREAHLNYYTSADNREFTPQNKNKSIPIHQQQLVQHNKSK